jgi:hypothetical protein
MYVLTREHNQYNQYGAYFVAAFEEKPTHKMMKKIIKKDGFDCLFPEKNELIEHILTGGGRIAMEDVWYNLEEISFNECYDSDDG